MNKNFQNNVVLTSQNPEAFLVYTTTDTTKIYIDVSAGGSKGMLLINGWDISKKSTIPPALFFLELYNDRPAPFTIYTTSKENFDLNVSFLYYSLDPVLNPNSYIGKDDVSIHNRPSGLAQSDINSYPTYPPLVDDKTSYMLLRTNPLYSGNIKLVIDSSNNMFLDTFKVSSILSNKKYRKQTISANSFLSSDIRTTFASLPKGELYAVDSDNTLKIDIPKTEYKDQYNMTYSYGARIFKDELYDEDYSILAPIWINDSIPSHFAVFRCDGVFNSETYEGTDLSNLATDFLKQSKLIKSWNTKDNTSLGKYLNNHLHELGGVISPVNLSLNEEDPNTWYGIAADTGIVTGRSENPYFFEEITHNFTDVNAWVSQGFFRNTLLCPNLVNTEFLFNDDDASLYSMHRYFGLYLNENELYKISYYSDTIDGSVQILSLDGRDVESFINSGVVFDSSNNMVPNFQNRIIVLNDGNEITRISTSGNINGDREFINQYVNKLGKNIFSTYVEKIDPGMFITLTINNRLNQGEHLRIINKTKNKIWEIYGVDTSICVGQYVSFNEPSTGYPTLYRTTFSTLGTVNDQINSIKSAFDVFKDYEGVPFRVGIKKDLTLSVLVEEDIEDEFLFQRITSSTLSDPNDPSSAFSTSANENDIIFYGVFIPSVEDFYRVRYDASYGPIDFELFGDRMTTIFNLVNTRNYHTYSFNSIIRENFTDYVLYQAKDNYNYLIKEFDISTGIRYTTQYIADPTSIFNKFISITKYEIELVENRWNGYDVFPLSISIMGIIPVKDFDFTVYDSSTNGFNFKSKYWYKRNGDVSTYDIIISAGEVNKNLNLPLSNYQILVGSGIIQIGPDITRYNAQDPSIFYFNNYFNRVLLTTTTDTIISYDNRGASFNYTSYDSRLSEEDISDYYTDDSKKKLKYGLVVPTVSKWCVNGTDCRSNPVRLNLTSDLFEINKKLNTNFIPYQAFYSGESTYPVFKYLTPGEDNWRDYIYYDIYDTVTHDGVKKTLKQLIFDEPYIDVFSKIIYSSFSISDRNNRSSVLYYDIYNDIVTGVLKGLKISFKVSDVAKRNLTTKNWDKYRFSFISTSSINRDNNYPIEVIINENTESILMIWYQGNDTLHYTKRYSDIIAGKNTLIDSMNTGIRSFYGIPTGDASYAYVKSPYYVNTNSVITSITNKYNFLNSYDSSISNRFSQLNVNTVNNVDSVFTAYGNNNDVASSVFNFSNKVLNTFNQLDVVYGYTPSTPTIGADIVNIAHSYMNNYNYYKNKTVSLSNLKSIINSNYIFYYVITGEEFITNKRYIMPPVITSIKDPIVYSSQNSLSSVYTYNGAYKPIFKDILNFSSNDDYSFISLTKRDYIFANTNLKSYNTIDQYWFNRVVKNVTTTDSSNNIMLTTNFSPFLSSWDAAYYTLCQNGVPIAINGYESNEEIPSFFGSKLIKLPDQLVLNRWNASNSNIITTTTDYVLQYNITESIRQMFLENSAFIQNWSNLPNVADFNIIEYINKTIIDYYNIDITKINADIFYKSFRNINRTSYDIISSKLNFLSDSHKDKLNNVNGQLVYDKGNYIYIISVPISDNRSYFTQLTFNKK